MSPAFGAIGTSAGLALGTYFPGYYRSVIRSGREPGFDPVGFGIGQGLTQGILGGVVIGFALVALFRYLGTRPRVDEQSTTVDRGMTAAPARMRRRILIAGGVGLGSAVLLVGAFMLGAFVGEGGGYRRRFQAEQESVSPIVARDAAYAGVEVQEASSGGVYLAGEVPTQADYARLRAEIVRALGERRAGEAMTAVKVKSIGPKRE